MLNDIDSRRLFCVDELLKQESNERGKEFTMKKISALFMVLILTQGLCACTATQPEEHGAEASQGPTWQEQYGLGVRYLSEGNYEEAVLAFTAAIEIDPKRAPAYVGRGDAYVLSGETEENLTAAKADYETAIELDETSAEAYLGLADVYIRQGDYEKALEILRQGYEATPDARFSSKQDEIMPHLTNEYGSIEFTARDTFIPAENLSAEQINIINTLIEALTQNNCSAFENIVRMNPQDDVFGTQRNIYTLAGKYKVKIWSTPFSWLKIEIRSENGLGYYGEMHIIDNPSDEKKHEIFEWNYSTCPCSNWQPNGTYQKYCEAKFSDGSINATEATGTSAQGLCIGSTICNDQDLTFTLEYDASGYRVSSDGTRMWGVPLSGIWNVTDSPEAIWW